MRLFSTIALLLLGFSAHSATFSNLTFNGGLVIGVVSNEWSSTPIPQAPEDPDLPADPLLDWDTRYSVFVDDGVTAAIDGQAAQKWTDRSGGNHATNDVSTARATYVANWRNGVPALLFDGSTDFYRTAINRTDTDFTLWAVVSSYELNQPTRRIVDKDYANGFWVGLVPSANFGTNIGAGFRQITAPYALPAHNPTTNGYSILVVRSGTTLKSITPWQTNTATVVSGAMDNSLMFIGADETVNASAFWRGHIARIVYWDRALSAAEWGTLTNIAKQVYDLPETYTPPTDPIMFYADDGSGGAQNPILTGQVAAQKVRNTSATNIYIKSIAFRVKTGPGDETLVAQIASPTIGDNLGQSPSTTVPANFTGFMYINFTTPVTVGAGEDFFLKVYPSSSPNTVGELYFHYMSESYEGSTYAYWKYASGEWAEDTTRDWLFYVYTTTPP